MSSEWSSWSEWICPVTCGYGRAIRTRSCNGKGCPGEAAEERVCNEEPCQGAQYIKIILRY